jgi:hypothetical protein
MLKDTQQTSAAIIIYDPLGINKEKSERRRVRGGE